MKYKLTLEFELSGEEFDLLNKINEAGYAEYRDFDYRNLEDKLNTRQNGATEKLSSRTLYFRPARLVAAVDGKIQI